MHSCPSCQAQMLDFLYDLLDDAERQAMRDHLDACAACRAELEKARGQQNLMAAAARMEFPGVRFTAPEETPAVVPMPAPARKKVRPWRRWAAAAAILLAIGGLAAPGWWAQRDYAEAAHAVETKQGEKAAAEQQMKDALARIQTLPAEEGQKITEVRDAARAAQLEVAVVGQPSVVAGAPATYEIQTTNLNGQAVAADVSARVADAGKQPVGDPLPVVKAEEGKYKVTLPPDLQLKPDGRLTLVVSARRDSGVQAQVNAGFDLAAPVYVTHLETDKPMYQPGEVVHYRSLTLDRFSLRPAEEDLRLTFELVTPTGGKRTLAQAANGLRDLDGVEVFGPDGKPVRGVGAGDFILDPKAEGGEYVLVCREEGNRFPEQRRKFIVNNYPKPQLNKQLDFGRSTYGPGDEVAAACKATRADGEPVRNQPVEATVLIDDHRYGADGKESRQPLRFQTGDRGEVVVRFKLPEAIERGEASLAVKFVGPNETIVRPLPIVLKKLDVEFYPEGGDLAAGLPNRVYFQARTPLGKPADLKGRLFEDGEPLSVAVETAHDEQEPGVNQGMGRFGFTPKAGKRYEVEIDSPVGITERVPLPKVADDGVALSVPEGVVEAGQPIKVTVYSKTRRDLMVGLYCRGRLLQSVQLNKGDMAAVLDTKADAAARPAIAWRFSEVVLNPEAGAGGVCRVTVFEETPAAGARRELKPVAERLIYRRPAEQLTVHVEPDRSSYVPGQHATLSVAVENEKHEAAPALATVAVVDKSVLTLADEKVHRSMPTHFFLTSEVRRPEDLEYADFLLEPGEKAESALDLLLGVQGWRRFAEQDPARFREKDADKEEAERLLVMSGQSTPRRTDLIEEEIKEVRQDTDAHVVRLKEQYDQAADQAKAALADPGYAAALARKASYDHFVEQARSIGAPLVGAALLLAALAFLVLGVRSGWRRGAPWYAAAAASLALMVVAAGLYRTGGQQSLEKDNQVAQRHFPAPPEAQTAAERMDREAGPDFDKADAPLGDDKAAGDQFGAPNRPFGLAKGTPPPPAAAPLAPPPGPAAATGAGLAGAADKPKAPAATATAPAPAGLPQEVNANLGAPQDGFRGPEAKDLNLERALGKNADAEAEALRQGVDPAKKLDDLLAEQTKKDGKTKRDVKETDLDEARRALVWRKNMEAFNRLRDLRGGAKPAASRAQSPAMVVREFAHVHGDAAAGEPRSDFTETLYWRPVLLLPGGKADVAFDLCDSTTTFQATVFAHTLDGRLGAGERTIESRLPFTLHPATPVEVTASDRIDVPLSVANNTPDRRDVQLTLGAHTNLSLIEGKGADRFGVDGGKTARLVYGFRPTVKEGEAVVEFAGRADAFAADAVRARFRVVPEGFPVAESRSDLLEGSASQTLTLPDSWVKGTLKCQVQVFPSTLADLQQGLESLLREPNGCFEQTSTRNYPNLLILDYLKESGQTKPEVERRARELLARGYQKLTSFECTDPAKNVRQGYEWFGGAAPPHEALTAYGLLEFRDMARVQDVDPVMLKRTQDYLLSRRDGKGGFQRNPRAIDSFGRAPDDVTNAYIVWALTESGKDDDLTAELNALAGQAKASHDPYFLSLVANSLINRARTDEAAALLKAAAALQKEDGHLDAEKTSITGSGGRDLQIETTALAVLGWLKADPGTFNQSLRKAVAWIGKQRGGYGGFGSTQSTILALKALIEYTKANKRTAEGGELRLYVGGKEAAKLAFPAGASDALTLELKDAEQALHPGANDVRVEVTGHNTFPYTLAWTYQTLKPVGAEDCPVRLETKLSETEVKEGDLVRLNVTLENVSGKGQGMATAVIGLPGGLAVPEDMKQLKLYCREPEDGSRPLVSAFEVRGRELVLYWRDLAPGQTIRVPLDLIARYPGDYTGPASRGYLYYNADHKHWVDPLHIAIGVKAE